MNRRQTGFALIGLGSVIAVIGLVLFATLESDSNADAAAPTTTGSPVPAAGTTAPPASPTTTTAGSPSTTEVPATTTATTSIAPTTTLDLGGQVDAFVAEFAAATASDDVEFLLSRLHPLSVQASDEPTCASFVSGEIVALEQYRATGPAERTALEFTISGQVSTVDPAFEVPVAFTFSGQEFTDIAHFAPVDGVMHYLATCR